MQPGQGSGRNGDHYLFRPAGVPADASMYVDFVARRAWRGMAASVEFEDMFSCTRSTVGYAETSAGGWEEFAIDEARITDRGLLIEPSSTNSIRNNSNAGQLGTGLPTNWAAAITGGLTTEVFAAGTEDGLPFTEIHVYGTASAGQWFLAVEPTSGLIVAPGEVQTLSLWFKLIDTTNSPNIYQTRFREQTGGSVVNNINQSFVPSGFRTLVSQTRTIPASINNVRPGISAGLTSGQPYDFTFRVYAIQMEIGDTPTSPVLTTGSAATRAADAVSLSLPAGTHDVTFVFDDGSTQTVAGQSGTPAIPTNLNRRVIRSMKAVAV